MVVSVSVVSPLWSPDWLGAVACCYCPASQESILPHIASLRKGENSKYEVQFVLNMYCFSIAKLKNRKFIHLKSGNICVFGVRYYPLGVLEHIPSGCGGTNVYWKTSCQCDGIRRGSLWAVTGSWGPSCTESASLYKELRNSLPFCHWEVTAIGRLL